MTSLRRILLATFLGVLTSAGVGVSPAVAVVAGDPAPHAARATYAPVSYTVKNGHKVTITLRTDTDGGYSWAITQGRHSPKFTVLSKKVVSQAAPGTVGGYSKTIYVLKVKKVGNATFQAVERRPFDKTDVINRYTLHLHITRN